MGRVRAAILTATAIALLPVVGSEPVQALGPERTGVKIVREWTPKDSIPVRSFDPEEIKISPDGKFLFYINYHGDLSCDCDEYELVVFSLADINKALKNSRTAAQPYRRLLRRSSGDDTFAIYPAEWTSDTQNISFQGSDANGRRQYYEYNLPSGQVRALTSWDQEIDSLTHEKDSVVSNVWIDDPDAAPSRYPMYVMSRDDMSKTGVSVKAKARKLRTFVSFKGANPWQIKESDHLPGRRMYFSSDARQIVMLRRPTKNSTG